MYVLSKNFMQPKLIYTETYVYACVDLMEPVDVYAEWIGEHNKLEEGDEEYAGAEGK